MKTEAKKIVDLFVVKNIKLCWKVALLKKNSLMIG